VESSLLSVYAVDPLADELIARIRGSASIRLGRDAPLQEGDYLVVMMVKDGLEMLDRQLEPTSELH
jgi:hypothetical protein